MIPLENKIIQKRTCLVLSGHDWVPGRSQWPPTNMQSLSIREWVYYALSEFMQKVATSVLTALRSIVDDWALISDLCQILKNIGRYFYLLTICQSLLQSLFLIIVYYINIIKVTFKELKKCYNNNLYLNVMHLIRKKVPYMPIQRLNKKSPIWKQNTRLYTP